MKSVQQQDLAGQIFGTRKFLKTLSYREFATSLSLALLLLALFAILDYYSDEDWIANNYSLIRKTLFCIIFPLNHVFYRIEHKRQNNFMGRNLHDYIFLLSLIALYKLEYFINAATISFGIDGIGTLIVFMLLFVILVMAMEAVVALLKRALRLFRWQIL